MSGAFLLNRANCSVIASLTKQQLGDMTFQEAYEKTRRVLNVIIPFEGGRRSVLMNFLTTPNVVRTLSRILTDDSLFGRLLWQVTPKAVSPVSGATSAFSAKMKRGK